MLTMKHLLVAVALTTAASVSAVPAYAGDDSKPDQTVEKSEKSEKAEKAEKAKKAAAACTSDELKAFLAAKVNAEKAEKAKAKAEHAKKEHGKDHHAKGFRSGEDSVSDAAHEAEKAKKRAEEEKAAAAHKAEKAKKRAAEERAHAAKKLAKACAEAKAERLEKAKKEANRKARARKFQAIGIVVSTDAEAGTVTVMVKAGSPDLHRRKLAIKVTDDTRIKLDAEDVELSGLTAGTFVSVHGVRHEGSLVAGKINAASPGVDEDAPAETAVG